MKSKFLILLLLPVSALAGITIVGGAPINNPTQNKSNDQIAKLELQINELKQNIQELKTLVTAQGKEIQQFELKPKTKTKVAQPKTGVPKQNLVSLSSQPPTISPKATKLYQSAFNEIQTKKYSDAIATFESYLHEYPHGEYVPESHYWLGQLFMLSGNSQQAVQEFQLVVNQYAGSSKASDAMLQLGSVAYSQAHYPEAKKWWKDLAMKFPSSSAARVANTRLDQLQREGY